jgi:hypothetical protein
MLTFPTILSRSIRLAGGLLVADFLAAYGLTLLSYTFIEIMGDLMLVEVAVLFIVAGLVDFSSSVGAAQFRKVIVGAKKDYSPSAHKEAQKKAGVFFLSGLIIFLILVGFAILNQA